MIDNLPLGAEYQYTPESISGDLGVTVNICAHTPDNTLFCLYKLLGVRAYP